MGRIRKSIKKPIISKRKKLSRYYGSLVINRNVFFFKKLITSKLNGQFFGEKSR